MTYRRRLFRAILVSCVASLSFATAALGFNQDVFMNNGQGLSAGNAKASGTAINASLIATEGWSDHTWCPTVSQGYGGYTSTPFTSPNWTANSPNCGPGYSYWSPNATSCCYFHGAAYNPNGATFDTFYVQGPTPAARFIW